jgi:phosphinothricin acetyltransferase
VLARAVPLVLLAAAGVYLILALRLPFGAAARPGAGFYPVIVAVTGHDVVAYGSLSPYQPKPAFARTVEDSVYVRQDRRGAGLGAMVLAELVRRARARGHHSILARITAKNTASLRLHRRHGFRPVGVERESAFKLGRWHDVTILQRRLDGA